ncbi:unnamed protein product [Mytilus coruscus]|uniref:VLIG-type G domain-containing protein n=1 Tax=Mytilus coruscus TaxID=42192 RepID=A0A6J8A8V5_MYTCO|nr:unnamed protein product [Mytilus coruscus]
MGGHSKYARCSIVVIKVFTQMMQEIIGRSPVHADQIYQIIMSTKKFKERLKHSEMKTIQTLQTEGFSKLDISLIYKIGKFFNFIPPPTRHWGATPLSNEMEIGDDVERIRNCRNKMVHRIDCEMSDEEMSAFFGEFIAVGERIDVYLNKQNDTGFRDKITWYQTCPLDGEIEENGNTLQGIESLKEQFQVSVDKKVIHIFYGNSMKELIEGIRQEEESSSSAVIFVVKGVEDSENKAELLNSLSDQINSGSVKIQFKEARKGSIILYTDIKDSVLQNCRSFIQELTAFMERVFILVDLKLTTDETCNVIVIPNEDDQQTLTDVKSYENIEKTDLVLELNVSNEIFDTDESIQMHVGCFVEKVSRMTNGKEVLIRSDRIAVLYPDENGRDLNENKPDNKNQNKDEEKRSKESCENKSQYQIPEEHVTEMVQAQSPTIELSDTVDENKEDVLKEKKSKEITDKNSKDRSEMPCITERVEKQIVKTSLLSNEEKEIADKILADKQSTLEGLIKNLGLDNFFPDKINLMDVMVVKNHIKSVNYTDVPWIVLRSLVMGNFNSRDKMLQEFLDKTEKTKPIAKLDDSTNFDNFFDSLLDEDENSLSLNPMDLLVVLFYCSSPIFKQILAQKLFLCKLAIPIFFPSLTFDNVSFCTWILQTIVIDCKTESKGSLQSEITNCPCHTVGFMRLGKISVSKSKVINDVLTDQYHNTFFNKDCPLGTSERTVSDGTIECAWILPSDHSDFSNDVVMCMNLRGDGLTHGYQTEIISLVSSVVVVLVDATLLQQETTRNVLLNLHKLVKGLVIAIDAYSVDKNLLKVIYKDFTIHIGHFIKQTEFCILSREGKATSFSDIKKSIRWSIKKLTDDLKPLTLSERLNDEGYTHSEVDSKFKECKKKAKDILGCMPVRVSNVKDKIVPLQGETWRTWTKYCKTLNKSSQYTSFQEADTIKQKMIEIRSKQLHVCENVGPFMKLFIEIIVEYLDHDLYFTFLIWWLKLLLDDRSRLVLPKYLAKYQQDWQALRSVKNKKQNEVMETLRRQLNKSENDLAEASFGLEHLIRELGQMYEAMIECKWESPCDLPLATNLATIGAKMILNGQPFELMDGDAANVPLIWTKAILTELKHMIGDKKLLALSVLGVQSSGKSTLLNTMFGLQFVVSAGRCTRGVFMQLVKVEKRSVPVDYIVVIDAEGLRAPELAHQKYSHDNELATFVIGLGDITIINIKGENTAEVQDVLQIAVHAFLRLKLANSRLNLKQSCIFIHQNVPASDANDKMMQGRQKFLETLDEMTQEAADQENIADIHSFSQVIDFDCNKDVWYLSDLWNGDPPMAPINPGYTRRVDEVGNTILYELASVRETYLTITDTIVRIDDLWKGILKDDFVFSFRNSLELKAYNNMEQKFQELSWKLEKFVTEFVLSEAKGEFMYCSNEEDLTKAIPTILKLCSNNVYKQVNVLINELEFFVESSSLKDVMIQWKQNKENRLRMMSEDLIDRSKASILKTKEEIRIEKLRMNAQKTHEMEINERAQQLATEMRGAKPTTDVLKNKFDLMWDNWMTKFNTETSEDCTSIKDQIESLIWDKFRSDAAFLECQTDDCESNKSQSLIHIDEYTPIKDDVKFSLTREYGQKIACDIIQMSDDEFQIYHDLIQLEGSIGIIDIADCHIQIKRSWFGFGKEKEDKVTCKQQTLSSTNNLLQKMDVFLVDVKEMNVKFNIRFANEILRIIQHHIESQNRYLLSMFYFALTTSYEIMVTKHIIRYAMIWFTHLNVKQRKRYGSQSKPETALGIQPTPGNSVSGIYRNMKRNKQLTRLEGSINTSDILTNHISMIQACDEKKLEYIYETQKRCS